MAFTPDQPFEKSRGDVIRSKDWNDAIKEIQRLYTTKVNKAGDTMTGPLTLTNILPSYGTLTFFSQIADVEYDGGADGVFLFKDNGGKTAFIGGNVGIGTNDPKQKLTIEGPNNAGKDPASGMSAGGQFAIKGNAPQIDFIDTDHNDWAIHVNSNKMYFIRQPWIYTDLVLDGSGNVGIGTDSPTYRLDVKSGGIKLGLEENGGGRLILANSPNDNKIFIEAFSSDGDTSANELLLTGRWGVNVPKISLLANNTFINGNVEVNGVVSSHIPSDISLKQNVGPLSGALDKLLQLHGVTFEWKEPEKLGNLTGRQMGMVAQEVEKIFPEWVGETSDGLKSISIRGFEALVVEAFRDLEAKVKALETKLG